MKFKKFTSLFLSLAMIFAAMGNLCITASAEEVYEFTYNITNESSVAKSFDIILALCNENGGVETCDVRNVLVEANSTLTETVSVSVEEYVYLAQIYCSYNGILLNDWVEISLDGGIRSYDYQFSCTSFNTDGISA